MIKNLAWNMFKNTGNIDTFLEFKQISDIENNNVGGIFNGDVASAIQKVDINGINKNQWNNNF